MHISAAWWKENCCLIAGMLADNRHNIDNNIGDDTDND